MAGPKVGDRISEYLLDELVGNGSFGQVFKAHHHIWKDQIVAVKIPTDSQFVSNLRKEGLTIHGLKHSNIVGALGLDPYADVPYLIMEFVDGCSLRQLIDAYPKGLPIAAAQNILCGILLALEHAHANGVVHRDVKPANILIADGGRKPAEHQLLAEHLTAEYRVRTEARGRIVDEWKLRAGSPDNHWFDCLVGCAVAASIQGAVLFGTQVSERRSRKRMKLSELQRSRR